MLDMVNGCKLIDIGYQGLWFTWTNCRKDLTNIRKRLDRVWCNLEWKRQHEEVCLRHLPRVHSDHHPILLGGLTKSKADRFTEF